MGWVQLMELRYATKEGRSWRKKRRGKRRLALIFFDLRTNSKFFSVLKKGRKKTKTFKAHVTHEKRFLFPPPPAFFVHRIHIEKRKHNRATRAALLTIWESEGRQKEREIGSIQITAIKCFENGGGREKEKHCGNEKKKEEGMLERRDGYTTVVHTHSSSPFPLFFSLYGSRVVLSSRPFLG